MKRTLSLITGVALVCCLFTAPAHAIVGAGFHWGFDFTLGMDDSFDKQLSFEQIVPLELLDVGSLPDIESYLPDGITLDSLQALITENVDVLEASAPFSLSRTDWNRSVINFGGKVFVDAVPVLDAIEVSFNVGAWEYDALLKYPNGELQDNITVSDINEFMETGNYNLLLQMDEKHLTLEEFGMSYLKIFGISKTPYVKVNIDLSIRKNVVAKPDNMKLFKLYLGGGPSLHLGTPIITPSFVEEVIEETIESAQNNIGNLSGDMTDKLMEEIIEKLINEAKNPTIGMHILAGTMVKLPVIPVGIYADAKFMIPFGDMDDAVDLGGFGFKFNTGVSLSF